jgi:hypothetical protein
MTADPWQLKSQHRWVDPSVLDGYEQRMRALLACHGVSCRGN